MLRKRIFIEGAFYHVTSRTNDKIKVFAGNLGRKIMELSLMEAKEKFHFSLTNYCVMPTHIHLLIRPKPGTNLSDIMCSLKTKSAKRWNRIHGSEDHMWGKRYFAKVIRNDSHYDTVMNYIDQNPVKSGLVVNPYDWKASGAYQKYHNLTDIVDYEPIERIHYLKLLE